MKFIDIPGIREQLYPFTLTRPVEDIRVGILTIREKWQRLLPEGSALSIPSHLIPSEKHRRQLLEGRELTIGGNDLLLQRPWHIFQHNSAAIQYDFELLTAGRRSAALSSTNKVSGRWGIFLEEGAVVEHAIINTSGGPVYIGRNAEIMEGCMIRGPLAMCESSVLKMGSKVYGATTLGPFSTGGGEIKNSVIFGYSNKGHDGYLGDSVIGEWCNLGAGTSNSNLKNNAGKVSVYDFTTEGLTDAGIKCGLLMGDYSRAAINTSFNTGTVVGAACNVFCDGLTPKYIPSFSWGANNPQRYDFDKAVRDIDNWKKLKKQTLTSAEITSLRHIFDNIKHR